MNGLLRTSGTVAIYGHSGFVGNAVRSCLVARGVVVVAAKAPRLRCVAMQADEIAGSIDESLIYRLREQVDTADVVVNAAGLTPEASDDPAEMMGANALFAGALAIAAARAGIRLVHVSSSAVQGSAKLLTARGPLRPFNAYSSSKAVGERLVGTLCPSAISLRPASVHGSARAMTRRVASFAQSRAAFTLAPGTASTPQMHVANVAAGISHLAMTAATPPAVVLQPSEGFTTQSFLQLMGGGRPPQLLPRAAGPIASCARPICSRVAPQLAQQARRLELLMHGQEQESSWLTSDGFSSPFSHADWREMVQRLQAVMASR